MKPSFALASRKLTQKPRETLPFYHTRPPHISQGHLVPLCPSAVDFPPLIQWSTSHPINETCQIIPHHQITPARSDGYRSYCMGN